MFKAKLEEPEFSWNDRYKAIFLENKNMKVFIFSSFCMLESKSVTQSKSI